jgi:multiple sugar transport system substrate-binding protein
MISALGFLERIQDMGIYSNSDLAVMLDANSYRVLNEKFPLTGEVGIVLDGNWKGADWINALGDTATDVIAVTPMPNEKGDGFSSMSGGWTLGISPLSKKQDIAFAFIQTAVDKEGSLALVNMTGDMTVRKDVVSEPSYMSFNPYRAVMSSFTEFTKFRPGVDAYPSVSIEIQTAVESVVSGQMTAAEAASVYARNVKSIVGDGNWIEK